MTGNTPKEGGGSGSSEPMFMSPKRELLAVKRALLPHKQNNNQEKMFLWALIGVWVVIELGILFYNLTPPASVSWIRSLVALMFGQMLGMERGRERFENRQDTSTNGGENDG